MPQRVWCSLPGCTRFVLTQSQIPRFARSLCPLCSEIEELRLQCLCLDAEFVVARRLEDIVRGLSQLAEHSAWESRFDQQHGQASAARAEEVGPQAVRSRSPAGAESSSGRPAFSFILDGTTPTLARPADSR